MSAPHVAGVLAAILQENPELTPQQVRDVLLHHENLDPLTGIAALTSTGGRLNHFKALNSPLVFDPKLNNYPTLRLVNDDIVLGPGEQVVLNALAGDFDSDLVRVNWIASNSPNDPSIGWVFSDFIRYKFLPVGNDSVDGSCLTFTPDIPVVPIVTGFSANVADGNGGHDQKSLNLTVLNDPNQPVALLPIITLNGFVIPGQAFSVDFNGRDSHGRTMMYSMSSCNVATYARPPQPSLGYYAALDANWACAFHATAIGDHGDVHTSNRLLLRTGAASGTPPFAALSLSDVVGHASPESPFVAHVKNISFAPNGAPLTHTRIVCHGGEGSVDEVLETDCRWTQPGTYWVVVLGQYTSGGIDYPDRADAYVFLTKPGIDIGPSPLPEARQVSPSSAHAGSDYLGIVVMTRKAQFSTTVRVNGHDRPTTYISPDQVNVYLFPEDLAVPGAQSITVFSPGFGGGESEALTFQVL